MNKDSSIALHPKWKENLSRFAHRAMATQFEIYTTHADKPYAQQAAGEAFSELDRLEQELSHFIPGSDIDRINKTPPGEPVSIGLEAFECLQYAQRFHHQTKGCFDVSLGYPHFILDESRHTFTWKSKTGSLDLGGIGKGFAIDQMAALLQEWEVHEVLLHGGFSTVYAMNSPQSSDGWPLTVSHPRTKIILQRISLKHSSISGSGIRKTDHIINPHTNQPVRDRIGRWCMGSNATETDALSTAAMIMNEEQIDSYCEQHPEVRFYLLSNETNELKEIHKEKSGH